MSLPRMPWTVKQHLINSLAQKYLTKHAIDCLFNTIKLKKSSQREELKSDVNVVRYLKLPVRTITSCVNLYVSQKK